MGGDARWIPHGKELTQYRPVSIYALPGDLLSAWVHHLEYPLAPLLAYPTTYILIYAQFSIDVSQLQIYQFYEEHVDVFAEDVQRRWKAPPAYA